MQFPPAIDGPDRSYQEIKLNSNISADAKAAIVMIDCNECGKQISDSAPHCPHCGAPVVVRGTEIKAHQILGVVIMISGLALYLVTRDPVLSAVGGMLLVVGFLGALL